MRKKFPSAPLNDLTPTDGISQLLKMWSLGDNRPENGAFVGFRTHGKKGKVVFPQYY